MANLVTYCCVVNAAVVVVTYGLVPTNITWLAKTKLSLNYLEVVLKHALLK